MLPDIILGVAGSVVVVIFSGCLYSKSRSLYTNLGPCSKHWKKFVANVFTPGPIPLEMAPEIQSNIPEKSRYQFINIRK